MVSVLRFVAVNFRRCDRTTIIQRPRSSSSEERRSRTARRPPKNRTRTNTQRCSLPWYSYLSRQIQTNSGLYFYKCEVCGSVMQEYDEFIHHRRNHFTTYEIKPQRTSIKRRTKHTCSVCHKSFTWLCHLKSHMRIHMGEKLYKCSECDYETKDENDLIMHQRIHTWDRLYRHTDSYYRKRAPTETENRRRRQGDGNEEIETNYPTCPPHTPTENSDEPRKIHNTCSKQSKLSEIMDKRTMKNGTQTEAENLIKDREDPVMRIVLSAEPGISNSK